MTIERPTIKLPTVKCEYCSHSWTPAKSGKASVKCPNCQSRKWWIPQKTKGDIKK